LEEPTEDIQPTIIKEMIETLQRLGEQRALTILLVSKTSISSALCRSAC
jgi:ABC-type branched-subunit amino acid transport system ATPase component